jgi:hypothetical protein
MTGSRAGRPMTWSRPWPRRLPDGRLVPYVGAWLRGFREARRLYQTEGLVLPSDPDRIAELGWSLAADEQPMTAEELDQALAPIREQNRIQLLAMDQDSARGHETPAPDVPDIPDPAGLGPGAPSAPEPSAPETHDRNEKIDEVAAYLAKNQDPPDDEWSPT